MNNYSNIIWNAPCYICHVELGEDIATRFAGVWVCEDCRQDLSDTYDK